MAKNEGVAERFESIAKLIADARDWAKDDDRLGAHLGSYICVLLLGATEYSVEHLVSQRVSLLNDKEVADYVVKVLGERFRNPNWGTINGLLGEFSPDYKESWSKRFPVNEDVHEALLSIVGIKNDLAHRGTTALQVTLRDVEGYFNRVTLAVDEFERIILPSTSST